MCVRVRVIESHRFDVCTHTIVTTVVRTRARFRKEIVENTIVSDGANDCDNFVTSVTDVVAIVCFWVVAVFATV